MSPSVAPPFPFYIINKDIIKGSFPFRKTFLTPKLDFATRFQPPRVFRRPEEPEQTTETEQTGGEGRSACRSPISQPDFDRLACPANPKNRNRTTETEQIGDVRKSAQPKFDFTVRFRNPISQPDFDRLACSADLKSRNKTTETEQTGGERNFPVRKTRQFKDYSIFAPEDFKTRFQTSPSGPSESPLLSPSGTVTAR